MERDEVHAEPRRAFLFEDVRPVLVLEITECRQYRVWSGPAERAERTILHVIRKPLQKVHVAGLAPALAYPVQDLEHPLRTYPAGDALAARLHLGEVQEVPGEVHHARGCLLYTSDAGDDLLRVDIGGRS